MVVRVAKRRKHRSREKPKTHKILGFYIANDPGDTKKISYEALSHER